MGLTAVDGGEKNVSQKRKVGAAEGIRPIAEGLKNQTR